MFWRKRLDPPAPPPTPPLTPTVQAGAHACPSCMSPYQFDIGPLRVRGESGAPVEGRVIGAAVSCGVCGTVYLSIPGGGVVKRNPAMNTDNASPPGAPANNGSGLRNSSMEELRWRKPKV